MPVVPVMVTAYRNPWLASQRSQSLLWRRRRNELHERDASAFSASRSSAHSSNGRSGTMKPAMPARRAALREAVEAEGQQRIAGSSSAAAAHRHSACSDSSASRIQRSDTPCAERDAARALDGGAVGHRIGERHADLDDVGRAAPTACKLCRGSPPRRKARRQERDDRGPAARACARGSPAVMAFMPWPLRHPRAACAAASACPCRRARRGR